MTEGNVTRGRKRALETAQPDGSTENCQSFAPHVQNLEKGIVVHFEDSEIR